MNNHIPSCKCSIRKSPLLFIIILSIANLLVMHYYILFTCHSEEAGILRFVSNALNTVFDIGLSFCIFYLITGKRVKLTLWLCFLISLTWSFSNIVYSRFFHHYLTLSAVGQSGTLLNGWVLKCVIESLRWPDLYFVFSFILGLYLLRIPHHIDMPRHIMSKTLLVLLSYLLMNIIAYGCYSYVKHPHHFFAYFENKLKNRVYRTSGSPLYLHFQRGEYRSLCVELWLKHNGSMTLSSDQKFVLHKAVEHSQLAIADTIANITPKNIIFIIVESYLAWSSDLIVDGKEVTPYLNALKRDSTCYYNGAMRENVTLGESSDGQFIYMTGLLPLRSMVTASKACNSVLPGLPKSLNKLSRMVIPTIRTVWEQDAMCRAYGFNKLYSCADFKGGSTNLLNDEQLFTMASGLDNNIGNNGFFSVILTMSMHEPYTSWIDPSFIITDSSIDKETAYYLNACHYTDRQIGRYLKTLKKKELFNNSIIVITADHAAHTDNFKDISSNLPIYIIAQGLPPMWNGKCNQIDVYPTLLDLLGIKQKWYGMGKSLLLENYTHRIGRKKWEASEWMILSDYFKGN